MVYWDGMNTTDTTIGEPSIQSELQVPVRRHGFAGQRMIVLPGPLVERALSRHLPLGIVPTDVGYFPQAAGHLVNRSHGSLQLIVIFCVQGCGWVKLGNPAGPPIAVSPGQAVCISPHMPHSYGSLPQNPWTIYWCHLTGPAVTAICKSGPFAKIAPLFNVPDVPQMAQLFDTLIMEFQHLYRSDQLVLPSGVAAHLISLLCAGALQSDRTSPKSSQRIEQLARSLGTCTDRTVTISELAHRVNLSNSHFCALFRRVIGLPPLEYFMRLKMRKACELLQASDLPVKEVAARMAFSDPLYFSRLFRRMYAMTPTQYRKLPRG